MVVGRVLGAGAALVVLGFVLATTEVATARADSADVGASVEVESDEAGREEKPLANAVSFGVAYTFHLLRDRVSETTGEPLNTFEHLIGFAISYERELIPEHLGLTLTKPFYFSSERFDTPFDFSLKALFRRGSWEGFIGGVITWNIRIYERERAEQEGEKNKMSLGLGVVGGGAYYFNEHWSLDLEAGYAYVPTDDIVTHEISAAVAGAYHF
jgi:hypothetical protein